MHSVQSFGGLRSWTWSYGPGGDDEPDEEETEYRRVSELVQDYAEPVGVAGVS